MAGHGRKLPVEENGVLEYNRGSEADYENQKSILFSEAGYTERYQLLE